MQPSPRRAVAVLCVTRCLSPCDAHVEENASTLAYAARARAIVNAPVLNVDPRMAQVGALQAEILHLKEELQRLSAVIRLDGGGGDGGGGGGGALGALKAARAAAGRGGDAAQIASILDGALATASGGGGGGGSVRTEEMAALQGMLEDTGSRGVQLGSGMVEGVTLAKKMALTNSKLREVRYSYRRLVRTRACAHAPVHALTRACMHATRVFM